MNIKHPQISSAPHSLPGHFVCLRFAGIFVGGRGVVVEVGYVRIFWIRLAIQGLTGLIVVVTSLGFLGINRAIAHRNAQSAPLLEGDRSQSVDIALLDWVRTLN